MSIHERGGDVVDAYLAHDQEPVMQSYRWSSNGTLETDPHGIPPVRTEVDDGELWPTVRDRKGNPVRSSRPDPDAVAAAVARSRAMQCHDVDELAQAPSHDEIAEVIAQGARHRAGRRGLADERHHQEIAQERAQITHEAQVADDARKHDNHVRAAQQRRERATDPTSVLVRLAWAAKWLPGLSLVPAVFALIAGAFNVAGELNRINPQTAGINWAVELLFTWPVVVILLAQMLGALPKPDFSHGIAGLRSNRYVGMEIGLTGMAILLNVGLHWLPENHPAGSAVWLVVPAGLGFSAYLVPRLVTDIRQALREWSAQDETPSANEGFSVAADLHRENPPAAAAGEVENRPENPARYGSKDRARAEFWCLVDTGEIDPDSDKVNAIAKRCGTRWENARAFVTEWRRTTGSAA